MTHIRFQSGLHSYLTIVIIISIATVIIVIIMTHIFNNLGFYSSFVPSSAIITLFITIFLVKIPPSKIIIILFVSVLPPTESVVHQNDGNARSEFSVFISNSLQRNMWVFFHKRAVCHAVTSKSISFCQLWLWPLTLNTKGGIHVPIRINFWKSSKRS